MIEARRIISTLRREAFAGLWRSGKGSSPKGAEAKGFPGQIHEQLSDCRICEVLCGVLSQFGESSLCCAEAYGGGAFLRNFDSRC